VEDTALEAHTLSEGRLEAAVDRLFRRYERRLRQRGNGFGDLDRLLHQACRRHHARNQAGALSFRGIHHASGQDQVHGLRLADRTGQALRPADAGDDPELDLGLSELGVIRGDDEIAHHGKLAAATECKTGNRGDDRLAHTRQPLVVGRIVGAENLDITLVRHFLDIGAGGKGLVRPGDEDAPHTCIAVESLDCVEELVL
jgi:hypothetical protein